MTNKDDTIAALAAPVQTLTWPGNAAEVREFMEDSCQREEYENDDNSPSVDDLYVLTAHDFLSAVNWWADSHYRPGAPQPAAQAALAALKHPAVKSDMLVNGGALKLALNVLRRAGKNEVADELECTAQAAPVDAAVQRESQYNRGFRHGYNRRDAEVKGALA